MNNHLFTISLPLKFIPGLPAFAVLAPIPNAPPVPAVNVVSIAHTFSKM